MRFLELRIPPPIVGLIIAGGMWGVAQVTPVLALAAPARIAAAVALAIMGAAISVSGVVAFRRARTTVNPLKPETSATLVSTGVYSFTRNPMYLGMALVLVGWAAWLASLWALAGPVLFALYITRFQIIPEERVLDGLFGPPFAAYKSSVRRWL